MLRFSLCGRWCTAHSRHHCDSGKVQSKYIPRENYFLYQFYKVDFLIKDASYRSILYICSPNQDPIFFQFAASTPPNLPDCQWTLVATRRTKEGADQFDAWLRSKLSLYTTNPQGLYLSFSPDILYLQNTGVETYNLLSRRDLPEY